ncbi:MAG: hypothetical protein ACI4PG_07680, partial [Candidatus Ventricola sp.]
MIMKGITPNNYDYIGKLSRQSKAISQKPARGSLAVFHACAGRYGAKRIRRSRVPQTARHLGFTLFTCLSSADYALASPRQSKGFRGFPSFRRADRQGNMKESITLMRRPVRRHQRDALPSICQPSVKLQSITLPPKSDSEGIARLGWTGRPCLSALLCVYPFAVCPLASVMDLRFFSTF